MLSISKTYMSHLEKNTRKKNETRWNKAARYSQEYMTPPLQKREQTKEKSNELENIPPYKQKA